jgi:AcrR family transcriptional regulator
MAKMRQEQRSERSRAAILEAALELFSHRGYGATAVRDIAERAGVSTGAVYHQFPDKEALFLALLEDFWAITERPDFPIQRALEQGAFPDNLPAIADAAEEVAVLWRRHIALIYVDVVEFDGRHIQRFYSGLRERFEAFVAQHPGREALERRMRPGIPAALGLLIASRLFIYYFSVERLFGVPEQFGVGRNEAVAAMAAILRTGMIAPEAEGGRGEVTSSAATRAPAARARGYAAALPRAAAPRSRAPLGPSRASRGK